MHHEDHQAKHRRKSLLYVCPAAKDDLGPASKVKGQMAALSTCYQTQIDSIEYAGRQDSLLKKLYRQITSEIRFALNSLKVDIVYYRYSPFCMVYNLIVVLLSIFKTTWIEYNTVIRYHNEFPRWFRFLHGIQIFMLAQSRATHLTVTKEIRDKERLPVNRTRVMPNGYDCCDSPPLPDHHTETILGQLRKARAEGQIIVCMVFTSSFPWHGISEVIEMLRPFDGVTLVLVGDTSSLTLGEQDSPARVIVTGPIPSEQLGALYAYVDFGLGPFNLAYRNLSEAAPIKVREYLYHGIPAIINYYDPLLEADWASPYLLHVHEFDAALLESLAKMQWERKKLRHLAGEHLTWTRTFQRVGVI